MRTVSTSVLSAFLRSMERRHGRRNIAPQAVMNKLIECLGVAEGLYNLLDPLTPGEPENAAETVVEQEEPQR